MINITKAELAQEVVGHLINEGLLPEKSMPDYSDVILDIQDIFSNHWDEEEV